MRSWSGPGCAALVGEHCAHLGITRCEMVLTRVREGLIDRYYWLPA
ncbi:hypothetical protein [Saccharopolyspora karakumensis]|nr:hypothetical protein [Saccharopolyspora karakumensis]